MAQRHPRHAVAPQHKAPCVSSHPPRTACSESLHTVSHARTSHATTAMPDCTSAHRTGHRVYTQTYAVRIRSRMP
eukprot:269009-Rhodomonas_salina.1